MPRRALTICAVVAGAAVAVLGWRAISVQIGSGRVYPAYSSLRADTEGAKALHDVAEALGRRVERNYDPVSEWKPKDAVVMMLGLPAGTLIGMANPSRNDVTSIAATGNTVVLAAAGRCQYARIQRWHVEMVCVDGRKYFKPAANWTLLDGKDPDRARAIERVFGSGSIILVSDTRTFTNAAVAARRTPAFVADLLERRPTVIFDEQHLGVRDQASVGALIRRYRLHGVAGAVLVVFAAFVWMSTSSFLPRVEVEVKELTGRDAGAALANLLRRTVSSSDVVSASIDEWARSSREAESVRRLRDVAARHTSPVDAYNAAARALRSKHED